MTYTYKYSPIKGWPQSLICKCGYYSTTVDELVSHRQGSTHLLMSVHLGQITRNDYELEIAVRAGTIHRAV